MHVLLYHRMQVLTTASRESKEAESVDKPEQDTEADEYVLSLTPMTTAVISNGTRAAAATASAPGETAAVEARLV